MRPIKNQNEIPTSNSQSLYSQEQVDQLFKEFSKRLELYEVSFTVLLALTEAQLKLSHTNDPVIVMIDLHHFYVQPVCDAACWSGWLYIPKCRSYAW